MGRRIERRCEHCGYNKKFNVDSGMRGADIDVIRDVFSKEDLKTFEKSLNKIKGFHLVYEIAYCGNCNDYIQQPVLIYKENGQEKRIVRKQCQTCENILNDECQQNKCPKCGEETKDVCIGIWD